MKACRCSRLTVAKSLKLLLCLSGKNTMVIALFFFYLYNLHFKLFLKFTKKSTPSSISHKARDLRTRMPWGFNQKQKQFFYTLSYANHPPDSAPTCATLRWLPTYRFDRVWNRAHFSRTEAVIISARSTFRNFGVSTPWGSLSDFRKVTIIFFKFFPKKRVCRLYVNLKKET